MRRPRNVTGQLLICDHQGQARLQAGTVSISDGVISSVDLGGISADAECGDRETLIFPGFIDAHLHLPQFDSIGAHGMPLLQWLHDVIFPSELRWQNTGWASAMTDRVIEQCLSVGTTGICAYATVHHDSTMQALQRAKEIGLRGVIGQVLMDRFAPEELCRDETQLIDELVATLEAYPVTGRMSAAVTPRFAISCSQGLLDAAGTCAKQSGAVIQTHLAETQAECKRVSELFDGKRYIDVYDDAGLLTGRSILGHAIHLSQDDNRRLAISRAKVAHCPTANRFLMAGTMNRARLLRHGVPMTLGSDVGAGYERSMVRVARSMIEAASCIAMEATDEVEVPSIPSAAEGWYQITAGNADALGWKDAGRLEPGASADILVVRPDEDWFSDDWLDGPSDPLSRLLFSWDDRWLAATILQGNVRYQSSRE